MNHSVAVPASRQIVLSTTGSISAKQIVGQEAQQVEVACAAAPVAVTISRPTTVNTFRKVLFL
jgi:hypothetical protein